MNIIAQTVKLHSTATTLWMKEGYPHSNMSNATYHPFILQKLTWLLKSLLNMIDHYWILIQW
jgi:hypothetical protein